MPKTLIRNQRQGGYLLKKNFVVYVVSTLTKGQQTLKVNRIVLKSLVSLKEVKDLNWCEFTLDSLVFCIKKPLQEFGLLETEEYNLKIKKFGLNLSFEIEKRPKKYGL